MPAKIVLLVEDDTLLRECLAEVLGDAGWRVAEAANAIEALDRMSAGGMPDVLVTDLLLGPGMSGLALAATARLRQPELRTVLISGADVAKLTIHPGDQFLAKPFNMAALVQVVTELARQPVSVVCRAALQP